MTIIPITECIDRETQSTVALATTPKKAEAMVAALAARTPGFKYYAEDPITVDAIEF